MQNTNNDNDLAKRASASALERARKLGIIKDEPTEATSQTNITETPPQQKVEETPQHINKAEAETSDSEPSSENISLASALSGEEVNRDIGSEDELISAFAKSIKDTDSFIKSLKEKGFDGTVKGHLRTFAKEVLEENKRLQENASNPAELQQLKEEYEQLKSGVEQYKALEDQVGGLDKLKDATALLQTAINDPEGFKKFWIEKFPAVAQKFGFIAETKDEPINGDIVEKYVKAGLIDERQEGESDEEYLKYANEKISDIREVLGVNAIKGEKEVLKSEIQNLKSQIDKLMTKPNETIQEKAKEEVKQTEAPKSIPAEDPNEIVQSNLIDLDNRVRAVLRYEGLSGEYDMIVSALANAEGFKEIAFSDVNKAEEKAMEIIKLYKKSKEQKKSTMIDSSITASAPPAKEQVRVDSVNDIPNAVRQKTIERLQNRI